jgi:hypothetical protein
VYPAGGQRGTTVEFKVGGLFLQGKAGFEMSGEGIEAFDQIREVDTLFFPGPVVTGRTASDPYDYPIDHAGVLRIAETAPTGLAAWRVWTSQGGTPARVFEVGDLPEVLEFEVDGPAQAVDVDLPVTINGRIHPREDTDIWSFECRAGESYRLEVAAARLGSPLVSRLEIRRPGSTSSSEAIPLVEDIGTNGADSVVYFTAPSNGQYQAYLNDVGYVGGQTFVYRLTIDQRPQVDWVYPLGGRKGSKTTFQVGVRRAATEATSTLGTTVETVSLDFTEAARGISRYRFPVAAGLSSALTLDVGSLPERLETEPNDAADTATQFATPFVANGQIRAPGDVDHWSFLAFAGEKVALDLTAARLRSRLQPVVTVLDADGKEVAKVTAAGNRSDLHLDFAPPLDGRYTVRVQERFASRGGPAFGYRLQVGTDRAEFRLTLSSETVRMFRGAGTSVGVKIERSGIPSTAARQSVRLKVEGLPAGVEVTGLDVPADKDQAELAFKSTDGARIGGTRLRISGTWSSSEGQYFQHTANKEIGPGGAIVDDVLLCVGLKTPFTIKARGGYYQRGHRGSVKQYPFSIDRGGFEGPITIKMSDKQRRHLQGAYGDTIVIPPGVDTFDYPFRLPANMSISRLARLLIMGVGEVVEADGSRHKITHHNQEDAQAVVSVTAGRLGIQIERESIAVSAGQPTRLAVRVQRGVEIAGAVEVALVLPAHLRGLHSLPLRIPAGEEHGSLVLELNEEWPDGTPRTMPLVVRATGQEGVWPVVADALLEVVTAP